MKKLQKIILPIVSAVTLITPLVITSCSSNAWISFKHVENGVWKEFKPEFVNKPTGQADETIAKQKYFDGLKNDKTIFARDWLKYYNDTKESWIDQLKYKEADYKIDVKSIDDNFCLDFNVEIFEESKYSVNNNDDILKVTTKIDAKNVPLEIVFQGDLEESIWGVQVDMDRMYSKTSSDLKWSTYLKTESYINNELCSSYVFVDNYQMLSYGAEALLDVMYFDSTYLSELTYQE